MTISPNLVKSNTNNFDLFGSIGNTLEKTFSGLGNTLERGLPIWLGTAPAEADRLNNAPGLNRESRGADLGQIPSNAPAGEGLVLSKNGITLAILAGIGMYIFLNK